MSAGLSVLLLFACSDSGSDDAKDDNNFQADVIECEDALARLDKCCPNFDAKPVLCNYYYERHSGCGSTSEKSVRPALSLEETQCIRSRSCGELVDQGVCARAAAARPYTTNRTTSSSSSSGSSGSDNTQTSTHPPVCP